MKHCNKCGKKLSSSEAKRFQQEMDESSFPVVPKCDPCIEDELTDENDDSFEIDTFSDADPGL